MQTTMNKVRVAAVLATMMIVLTACGGNGASTPNRGEAVVFVAVPLSGFQANGGQTVLGGVRLAAEELNRSGGLLGYEISVEALDDESDSEVAASQVETVANALQGDRPVLGIVGHLNSGQTLAAMEAYQTMDLIVITPTASEQSLTARGYTNFFRINANDAVQAAVDARFLAENLGARRVAVIHNDTAYGQGLAEALIGELAGLGAETAVQLEVAEGQSRYEEEVAAVRDAAPDAIFYAGYEIEAPYLRTALVEAGIDAPMLASDGAFLAATIDEAGGMAEGMYVSAFAASPRTVADPAWFEAYQAVEYRNPDTYSVNGYVAMQVLAGAARAADSLSAGAIAETLRNDAITTLLGDLRFEPDGDVVDPQIWIYQVQDGEFVQVEQ